MNYHRYSTLVFLILALLFAWWRHADAQPKTWSEDRHFLVVNGNPVAFVDWNAKRITFTGAAIEVCAVMPLDQSRSWCLPLSELQIILRERYKP